MRHSRIQIRWKEGLHLRPAALLVKHAGDFRSSILLKVNGRMANARSILGLLLLCATIGTMVDLEVSGEDEDAAFSSITSILETEDLDTANPSPPSQQ